MAYHGLQLCSEHVTCTVPDERTRVGFLADAMKECNDADVKAALANIRLQDTAQGMRNQFEKAVTHLLPTDPVKSKKKRTNADISSVADVGSAKFTPGRKGKQKGKKVGFKPTVGKTGVELRHHLKPEFLKLNDDQKKELVAHRKENGNYQGAWTGKSTGAKPGKKNGLSRADVSSILKTHDEEKEKAAAEKKVLTNELGGLIAQIVAKHTAPAVQAGVGSAAVGKRTIPAVPAQADSALVQDNAEAENAAASFIDRMSRGSTAGKVKVD